MERVCKLLTVAAIAFLWLSQDVAVAQTEDDAVKASMVTPGANPAGEPAGPTCTGDATQLLFPLDGTYDLVDFFGDGPTGSGPAQGPDQHNDDDSATVPLPFTFDLYGDLYTTAFVNNNGNLSFVTPFSTFSAVGFPTTQFRMVAPFWGDVDTGNPTNFVGEVYQKFFDGNNDSTNETLVVTWDNVGYYNEHGDLRNTFQVAISDGTNPDMGLGNNICFSWDNMCWTTGDASGGAGGFGGEPATVGANRGDGVEFFQIGRFDHAGVDYDGPFGNPDGVSFLDFSSTCFSTAVLGNIAPIGQGFPAGNTVNLDGCGDTLDLTVQFISPEEGQTVTVTVADPDGAEAAGLMITSNSPNLEIVTIDLDWAVDPADSGTYTLNFTATDDFNPPGQTDISLTINISPCPMGACCDAAGGCTSPTTQTDCESDGMSVYLGDDSACGGALEACCFTSGACTQLDPTCCTLQSGIPQGPGSVCLGDSNSDGLDDLCFPPPPTGACCEEETGVCLENQLEADCSIPGVLRYGGDGSTCATIDPPCEPPGDTVPTVSTWGLIVLALSLLIGAKIYYGRRRVRT